MATKKTETKTTKKAAPKKAETKAEPKKVEKKEVKREWKTGHPIVSGTYLVLLNGKETEAQWLQGFKSGKWVKDNSLLLGNVEGWTEAE